MDQSKAARAEWWEALSESERNVWSAKARSAGADPWELKKASVFDRGVTFDELLSQLDQDVGAPEAPAS